MICLSKDFGINCMTIKCYQNMMIQTLSVGNFCYNKYSWEF
jgi:hypothetical protein